MINIKNLNRSIRHGYESLCNSINSNTFNSVLGFDENFERTCKLSSAREILKSKFDLDLGFDMNHEMFSSMIGLGLWKNDLFREQASRWKSNCWNNRYHFFQDANGFAADTDCTAVAAIALYKNDLIGNEQLFDISSELMKSIPSQNQLKKHTELHEFVPMVYWEDGLEPNVFSRGCKQDAGVTANVLLTLEYAANAEFKIDNRIRTCSRYYLESFLESNNFINGTRYYPPNIVLYYASYLSSLSEEYNKLRDIVFYRLNYTSPNNALEASAQLIAFDKLNIHNSKYDFIVKRLLDSQKPNGSWAAAPFYSLGRKKMYFGSEEVTTMFAVKALSIVSSRL